MYFRVKCGTTAGRCHSPTFEIDAALQHLFLFAVSSNFAALWEALKVKVELLGVLPTFNAALGPALAIGCVKGSLLL